MSSVFCLSSLEKEICLYSFSCFDDGRTNIVFFSFVRCTFYHHHAGMQILSWFVCANGLQEVHAIGGGEKEESF